MNRFLAVSIMVCLASGPSVVGQQSGGSDGIRNLALARRIFTEIYARGDLSLVDQLYADDFVDDSPEGAQGEP